MAVIGNIIIGIGATTGKFDKGVRQARTELTGFVAHIETTRGALSRLAGAFAGFQIGSWLKEGIQQASMFEGVMAKVDAIFGEFGTIITTASKDVADRFGVIEGMFSNAAASFGAMFKGAGTAIDESARLGVQLAKLGLDMAAFNTASEEEVFTAISAALRGEFDPIERFNVFLNAARIEAHALAMGLVRDGEEITEYAKKTATLNLILQQTADQQGALERLSGTSASQFRKFNGQVEQLQTALGSGLLPAVTELATQLNVFLKNLLGTTSAALETDEAMAAISASVDGVTKATEGAALAAKALRVAWKVTQVVVTGTISAAVSLLLGLAETIEAVINLVPGVEVSFTETLRAIEEDMDKLLSDQISDLGEAWNRPLEGIREVSRETENATDAVSNLVDAVNQDIAPQISDAMRREAEALRQSVMTPLEKYQQELARIEKLGQLTEDGVNLLDDETIKRALEKARKEFEEATAPDEVETEDRKDGPTHAAALEFGSVEARRAILAFRGGGEPAEETASNTRRLVGQGEKTIGLLENIATGITANAPVAVGI